jgi:hypothetical protein
MLKQSGKGMIASAVLIFALLFCATPDAEIKNTRNLREADAAITHSEGRAAFSSQASLGIPRKTR